MTSIFFILAWTALAGPHPSAGAVPPAFQAREGVQPTAPDPAAEKAVRLAIDGRYEEASKAFRRLLRRSPEDPLLLYYLGLCHAKMQRYETALSYLEQAVGKEAPFPQAYYWLAQVHMRRDEREEARQALEDGLAEFPRNEDLLELQSLLKPALDPP